MDSFIQVTLKVVFLLSFIGWVSSCSLGIYKDENNLIALGAFSFFVSIFIAHALGSADE